MGSPLSRPGEPSRRARVCSPTCMAIFLLACIASVNAVRRRRMNAMSTSSKSRQSIGRALRELESIHVSIKANSCRNNEGHGISSLLLARSLAGLLQISLSWLVMS
ncbi:hypothetical protein C8R45DRAFT_1033530 [Mycena sanguinolenta]|nr:hypothetical protein C8R45DRAFT_1033530 [Mycena sanguinolenta]